MYPQYVEPLCDDVIQIRTLVEKALVRVKKSYKDSESGAENDRLYDMEIEYDHIVKSLDKIKECTERLWS